MPMKKQQSKPYKVERLEARVSAKEKEVFARAAAIQGRSLSEFMISTLHAAANEVIHSNEVIRLVGSDRDTFVNALLSPPKPSANLKAAAKRYLKQVKSSAYS
jgi:uncharacterized protein (DUF1778 family)